MSPPSTKLGICPLCESPVPAECLLAVMGDRRPTTFAECPTCGDVICPTDAALSERSS